MKKVKIDLTSLEESKDFIKGAKHRQIDLTFEADKYPEFLEKEDHVTLLREHFKPYKQTGYEIAITGKVSFETLAFLLNVEKEDLSINIEQEYIDVRRLHQEEYDYIYDRKQRITCPQCKSKFDFEFIQKDDFADEICPICEARIELEYETLEEALERKEKYDKRWNEKYKG